ncbi:MAG TPA: TonB-dependent receptor [Rhizomicrobium sp.]|jgi:outer membrane receptor protein involved in Fe transport|nr:TonB-dependent receptor [Rhizomicrobium sp.]
MNKRISKASLLVASSALALSAVPAFGQGSSDSDVEQVVVSASRISIAGYQQPTPVSVITAAALAEAANTDIGDTIRQLPSMGTGASPEKGAAGNGLNTGQAGVSAINLRNLGVIRNLVLFDGQRMVSPAIGIGADLSVFPSSLVQRVDVVTGGASAAWGSDAISGVVNLVLNKSFTGFKASLDGTDTGQDTRRTYGATLTAGFDLDGGRAHILLAATYNNSPSAVFASQAHWFNGGGLFPNPAISAAQSTACLANASACIPGKPANVTYYNIGNNATFGGAVTSGPLAGIQFGPGGTPLPYVQGVISGSSMAGGSTSTALTAKGITLLSYPLQSTTGFFYGSYKLTPDIQFGAMLNYSGTHAISSSQTAVQTGIVIKSDNPFLDPAIAARMATLGVTSFTTSSILADGVNESAAKFSDFYDTVGAPVGYGERQLYRGVVTLDGALGSDWSWNAAYQHSESHLHEIGTHNLIKANFTLAADAVRVTSANVGASGLTVGSIACRSTLTAPGNGCVPLNVLGTGVQSQAAVAYVNSNNNWQFQNQQQDTADVSMQGKLPWDVLGAGAPSVAFGADYRKEQVVGTTNPTSTALGYSVANFQPVRGEFNVEEGFGEIDIPLIKDGIVENLSANAAGRITSYSSSGVVETWKLGATSQINDDVRLRTTWSLDIRAPNLGELFSQVPSSGNPLDPKTGKAVPLALQITANNPNLQPEKAVTVSAGVVLTPHWVQGLSMSFDLYSINVHGFVSTPNSNLEYKLCLGGSAAACANYVYTAGVLTAVYLRPLNAASMTTSGLDFNADYATDLFSGNLGLHLTGNYVDEQTESAFGTAPFDFAGSMGSDSQYVGIPKLHFNLAATYADGPWSGTVQTRFTGTARLNNAWQTGVQVDNNKVSAVAYLDLRGSYQWTDHVQLYASIDNTLNTPPPQIVGTNTNNLSLNTAPAIYDILGRLYHVGIRLNY